MRIRIIPTKSLGCCAVPRTPESPTIPIAKPAAKPLKPTDSPAPRWRKDLKIKWSNMLGSTIHIRVSKYCTYAQSGERVRQIVRKNVWQWSSQWRVHIEVANDIHVARREWKHLSHSTYSNSVTVLFTARERERVCASMRERESERRGRVTVLQAMKQCLHTLCCTMRNLVETYAVNKAPNSCQAQSAHKALRKWRLK